MFSFVNISQVIGWEGWVCCTCQEIGWVDHLWIWPTTFLCRAPFRSIELSVAVKNTTELCVCVCGVLGWLGNVLAAQVCCLRTEWPTPARLTPWLAPLTTKAFCRDASMLSLTASRSNRPRNTYDSWWLYCLFCFISVELSLEGAHRCRKVMEIKIQIFQARKSWNQAGVVESHGK